MQRLLRSTHLIIIAVLLLTACNLPFGGIRTFRTGSCPDSCRQDSRSAQNPGGFRRRWSGHTPGHFYSDRTCATGNCLLRRPTLTPPNTLVPTKAPTATQIPTSTFVPIPCDRVDFVADVTIPDNTIISPGNSFTKTWRIKNSGSCSWTTNYKLVYSSGEQMGGAAATALSGNVNPGQTIDISVSMVAPNSVGTHQGYWRMQNASGGAFGWGINGDQAFWVLINTGTASTGTVTAGTGFSVSSVSISVNPTTLTTSQANCTAGVNFIFNADITATNKGTVTYEWRKTDNTVVSSGSVDFDSAGTEEITTTYNYATSTIGASASQLTLYINKPNHQLFTAGGTFILTCN